MGPLFKQKEAVMRWGLEQAVLFRALFHPKVDLRKGIADKCPVSSGPDDFWPISPVRDAFYRRFRMITKKAIQR